MKMTRFLILPFLFFSLTSLVWSQGNFNVDFDLEDLICKEQARGQAQMDLAHSRNLAAGETDIYYQVMRWDIDPAVNYIKGVITYYYKSRIDGLDQFVLDLANSHQINFVRRGNQDLTFTHSPDQLLTINLGKTLSIDQVDSVTVSYEGISPANGFGSFVQSSHENAPIIWTLSEPYGARDWWPTKQDLIDKVDSIDVYLTTPLAQLGASNGKLISITEENGKLVHHWSHRHPIASYLVALAVTNYVAYSNYCPLPNGDSIEILNYVYPESLSNAQQSTPDAVNIMTFYNEKFGTYPFADEKYGHAQFGWGGGMEHQTMSFMYNFSYGLMSHEMAHQWFGDKVTCGTWTDIWLNEGFATYLAGLVLEEYSLDFYWPQWKSVTSNSATSQPGGSVYVDDTTSVGRIFSNRLTYNKGAYLLHMLRWINGDDHFFQACRNYLNETGTAYDFGRTAELQEHLEAESGIDLDEFFTDWFYGQGFPSYHIQWRQEQDSIVIWINQAQSHPSVSYFEMPVPVWTFQNGDSTRLVMQNTDQDQRFSFYVGDVHIDSLQFDPERWILTRDNTVNQLPTGTHDPDEKSLYMFYPNPANDFIEFSAGPDIASASLINAHGMEMKTELNGRRLTWSGLSPGMYGVLVWNDKHEVVSIQPLMILH